MANAKPITIVGGGLAGLTLGIGLRQQDVPVTIQEAGSYPRHRVCGEFISGRGQAVLAQLKLSNLIDHAGAIKARTAAFYSAKKGTLPRPLPATAICLSRYALDNLLAAEFVRLGGQLACGQRWHQTEYGEGIIRATGRQLNHRQNGKHWFGMKFHARKVFLTADLEMHFSPLGYVGLCKISSDEVNVCGLFRKNVGKAGAEKNGRDLLAGQAGTPLSERFKDAEFDETSFCAVAGLVLQPQCAVRRSEICIGDALTMIPPVTGNGMSMAFESADLAIPPLITWSRGERSWDEARRQIATACDAAFSKRLTWAKWLQRMVLTPTLQNPLVSFAARSDWFWRMAFERTR